MLHICFGSEGETQRGGRNDHTQQGDAQQGANDGLRFAEHVQHEHQETTTGQGNANGKDRDKQIRINSLTEATEHGYKDDQGAVEEVCEEQIRCHSTNNHRNHPSDIYNRKKITFQQAMILERMLSNLLRECRLVARLKTRPTV